MTQSVIAHGFKDAVLEFHDVAPSVPGQALHICPDADMHRLKLCWWSPAGHQGPAVSSFPCWASQILCCIEQRSSLWTWFVNRTSRCRHFECPHSDGIRQRFFLANKQANDAMCLCVACGSTSSWLDFTGALLNEPNMNSQQICFPLVAPADGFD